MFSFKIPGNGPFTKMLDTRIKAWSAAPKFSVIIHTPLEIKWWYYNEFGTATQRGGQGVPTAEYYEIPGSGVSIFTYQGKEHVRIAGKNPVHHPGTKAAHVVALTQPDYQHAIKVAVRTGFAYGSHDSPKRVFKSMHTGMEAARELIAENYNALLQHNDYHSAPGGVEGTGKLEGKKAGDVYRALSEVRDIEE